MSKNIYILYIHTMRRFPSSFSKITCFFFLYTRFFFYFFFFSIFFDTPHTITRAQTSSPNVAALLLINERMQYIRSAKWAFAAYVQMAICTFIVHWFIEETKKTLMCWRSVRNLSQSCVSRNKREKPETGHHHQFKSEYKAKRMPNGTG